MKPWIKRSLIGLTSITVLLGGLTACGHRDHGRAWSDERVAEMRVKVVDRISGKLDLNAEQKAKLGVLADKLREQRNALVAGGDPRSEFASVIAGATFDRAKAKTLVDAKTGAISTKSPEVIGAMADFYDSLKPEQQAKVREFMASRGRHGWRG